MADRVSEPCLDSTVVNLLDNLPECERDYFTSEYVLEKVDISQAMLTESEDQYSFFDQDQWITYSNRRDILPIMWTFFQPHHFKARAGVSAGPKKVLSQLRKLIMAYLANSLDTRIRQDVRKPKSPPWRCSSSQSVGNVHAFSLNCG